MKFYNREKDLKALDEIRQMSFTHHSQMTVLTGRRRVGKTKLIFKSCEGSPTVYLFVSRTNEAALCQQFSLSTSKALEIFIPQGITSFVDLFDTATNRSSNPLQKLELKVPPSDTKSSTKREK